MLISLAGVHEIRNPEARVREYVRIEMYRGFDDQHAVNNEIGRGEIAAANRLFARFGGQAALELMDSKEVRVALAAVPDVDLDAVPIQSVGHVIQDIEALLGAAMAIRGVGLAVATKVLHLKRPHLIPILDSLVVSLLTGTDISRLESKGRALKAGIEAIWRARDDMHRQQQAFVQLERSLRDLPIPLTRVRVYDILCWSTAKWDVMGVRSAPYGQAATSAAAPDVPLGGGPIAKRAPSA